MRKLLIAALGALAIVPAWAEVWSARYGVAETFNFKLYNADGTLDVDEVDGGTEVSLSCNEGAETTATNDFVDEGTFYSIALTATEMQCERIAVIVAATTTEVFFIQTIDSTSAMTPMIVQTGDSFARLGAPAGASVSADIAAIEAQTDDIGVAGAGLTAIDLPNQTMDITGNITGNLSGSVGSVTGAVGSVTGAVGSIGSGGITEASFATTAGSFEPLGIIDQGTAQAATSTTLQLRAAAAFANDEIIGATCVITGGSTGVGQSRTVTDYVSSTDTATVDAWTTTPTGTIEYKCFGTAPGAAGTTLTQADIRTAVGLASANLDTQLATIDSNVDAILVDTGTTLQAEVDGIQADTEDIQARLPAALVAGRIDASVGAMAANTMTAAAAAADLTTELQTGLSTLDAAGVRTAVGLASANLDTQLAGIESGVDIDTVEGTDATDALDARIRAVQGLISGTCDSGSTTTCVDDALTQVAEAQLDDRAICFDDDWCALITGFTPGTDTVTTTKIAPSTRAARAYTIYPASQN